MKGFDNHPQILGDRCAQDMYNQPNQTQELVNQLGDQTDSYCAGRYHDLNTLSRRRFEAIFRTTSAVLLHAAEIELAEDLQRAQYQGKNLFELAEEIPSVDLDTRYIGLVSEPYEEFTGKRWDFLWISSLFSLEATRRFLHRILFEPNHWALPVYTAYKQNLPAYKQFNDKFVRFEYDPEKPDRQAYMHICENAVNSNVTVLDVFTAATRHDHYRLWLPNGSPATALRAKLGELSWPDSTSRKFFESRFKTAEPQTGCPFSHNPDEIATGSIYRRSTQPDSRWLLRDGPWPIRGKCPASIVLNSPRHDDYQNVSASQLRLASTIPIAAETLWA